MQDMDDMTKKYKEEMMRLYSRRPAQPKPAAPAVPIQTAVQATAAPANAPAKISTEKTPDYSHPPMPDIPIFDRKSTPEKSTPKPEPEKSAPEPESTSKFPAPEEIMRNEIAGDAVPVMAEEHRQGNYDFPTEGIEEPYPDEDTDFSAVDQGEDFPSDNPEEMSGQGYLQIEASAAQNAVPVQGATVIITEPHGGMESLIAMLITDENGETPVIPLAAPPRSLSGAPDPSERPYSEYNIGVYKKGFYTVPKLTVPIFDTIKSIQPIDLIPLAEFTPEGTEVHQ